MSTDASAGNRVAAEIVIPKENAVFRLDANGRWHNENGRFRNKRIIDFFHASIRRDAGGYYLYQTRGDRAEKVYFPYEDTPLFVFQVVINDAIELVLNTGQNLTLEPENLFVQNDILYVTVDGHRARFTDRSLMAISVRMTFEEDIYFIEHNGRRHRIARL
jgi:hypothetical protein